MQDMIILYFEDTFMCLQLGVGNGLGRVGLGPARLQSGRGPVKVGLLTM